MIAVVGDSNSDGGNDWPGILAQMAATARPKWQVVNYARSGATIINQPKKWPYWWFQTQVDLMLAASPLPAVVVLAGGTNDARGDVDVGVVMDKLFDLHDEIATATAVTHPDGSTGSALVLIAEVPVINPTIADAEPWDPGRTAKYTDAIRTSFSPRNVLGLRTIVTRRLHARWRPLHSERPVQTGRGRLSQAHQRRRSTVLSSRIIEAGYREDVTRLADARPAPAQCSSSSAAIASSRVRCTVPCG